MDPLNDYPTAKQLSLPLLELIETGHQKASELYEKLADEFDLSPLLRRRLILENVSYWNRRVRWAMQSLKSSGLIERKGYNLWDLTEEGKSFLINAKPSVIVTVFSTPKGDSVWAECQHAMSHVKDESVQLCFTSPPYELCAPKEYGNLKGMQYVNWLEDSLSRVKRLLTADGSLVLNLGNSYNRNEPTMSLYQEKLIIKLCEEHGYHLAQKLYWYNTTKLPTPVPWVSIERIRVKDSVENLWWLSRSPKPYADNRAVLKDYSKSQQSLMAKADLSNPERIAKPCGHRISTGIYRDNGGSIPDNIIVTPNSSCDNEYIRQCKLQHLQPHPARFPTRLPEFFIKLLTRPGDLVMDIFAGSNVTGLVAESLGRQWLSIEKSFHYIKTSLLRFPHAQVNPIFLRGT